MDKKEHYNYIINQIKEYALKQNDAVEKLIGDNDSELSKLYKAGFAGAFDLILTMDGLKLSLVDHYDFNNFKIVTLSKAKPGKKAQEALTDSLFDYADKEYNSLTHNADETPSDAYVAGYISGAKLALRMDLNIWRVVHYQIIKDFDFENKKIIFND